MSLTPILLRPPIHSQSNVPQSSIDNASSTSSPLEMPLYRPPKSHKKWKLYNDDGFCLQKKPKDDMLRNWEYKTHYAQCCQLMDGKEWRIKIPVCRMEHDHEDQAAVCHIAHCHREGRQYSKVEVNLKTGDYLAVLDSAQLHVPQTLMCALLDLRKVLSWHSILRIFIECGPKGNAKIVRPSLKCFYVESRPEDAERTYLLIAGAAKTAMTVDEPRTTDKVMGLRMVSVRTNYQMAYLMAISSRMPGNGLHRALAEIEKTGRSIVPDLYEITDVDIYEIRMSPDALFPNLSCSQCDAVYPLSCCTVRDAMDDDRLICSVCLGRMGKEFLDRFRFPLEQEDGPDSDRLYLLEWSLHSIPINQLSIAPRDVTTIEPRWEAVHNDSDESVFGDITDGFSDEDEDIDMKEPDMESVVNSVVDSEVNSVALSHLDGSNMGDDDHSERNDDDDQCEDEDEDEDSVGCDIGAMLKGDLETVLQFGRGIGHRFAHKSDFKKTSCKPWANRDTPHNVCCIICARYIYDGKQHGTFCTDCGWAVHRFCGLGDVYSRERVCCGCVVSECMEEVKSLSEWLNPEKYIEHQILTWLCIKNGFIVRCRPKQSAQNVETVKNVKLENDDDSVNNVPNGAVGGNNGVGVVVQGNMKLEADDDSFGGLDAVHTVDSNHQQIVDGLEAKEEREETEDFRYFFATRDQFASWRAFPNDSIERMLYQQSDEYAARFMNSTYSAQMKLHGITSDIDMGYGMSKLTRIYKSKFADKAHEAGLAFVHDPFDPNSNIWERIGELYDRIREMVKNDKTLNKAVNDRVKSKRRDSIWGGLKPDFNEKYNFCTKSELDLNGKDMKELVILLQIAITAYTRAVGTEQRFPFDLNTVQLVHYKRKAYKNPHVDGRPLTNHRELFGFTLDDGKVLCLGATMSFGNFHAEIKDHCTWNVPPRSMYVMYGAMLTDEWHSIERVTSKKCRTIMARMATLTLDPNGLKAVEDNGKNGGNGKQKKEKKNGKRNGKRNGNKKAKGKRKRKGSRKVNEDDEEYVPSSLRNVNYTNQVLRRNPVRSVRRNRKRTLVHDSDSSDEELCRKRGRKRSRRDSSDSE